MCFFVKSVIFFQFSTLSLNFLHMSIADIESNSSMLLLLKYTRVANVIKIQRKFIKVFYLSGKNINSNH